MERKSLRIGCVAASALAVFAGWLAIGSSAEIGFAFLFLVPIALGAWWFGPRGAAATVALCSALYLVDLAIEPRANVAAGFALRFATFVAVAGLVSLLRERVRELTRARNDLDAIQAALAPTELPDLPRIEAGVAFVPSELGVSGDFYLLTNGPDGSAVAILGDVVGHGPRAARAATFLRARLAALAATTSDPAEILTLANQALLGRGVEDVEPVSALCFRLDTGAGVLSWAVAGHPPPIRLPSLQVLEAPPATFLLGIDPDLQLSTTDVHLDPGDGVLAYTDGAVEVRRGADLLGQEGLLAILGPLVKLPPRELVRGAQRGVTEWAAEGIRDDICILALRSRAA